MLLVMCGSEMFASNRRGDVNRMFESYNVRGYNRCGFHIVAHYFSLPGADPGVKSVLQTRPVNDTSIVSSLGHFRIHFDTTGFNAPVLYSSTGQPVPNSAFAYADTVAGICEHVYYVEVDSLGFPPPASDSGAGGGNEYDIYIQSLPIGEYGYTDWDPSHPIVNRTNATYATWTVIRNEFESAYTRGIPAMEVTLAHEFHHGIQVGNYGLWENDLWFYELTSTWMEQVVYPQVKDYYQYLPSFFQNLSQQPFDEYDPNSYAGYERCVFGIFIQNEYGASLMKSIWEDMSRERAIPAIEDAFKSRNISPSVAFELFSQWNYLTGYRAATAPGLGVTTYPLAPAYPVAGVDGTGILSSSGVSFSGRAPRLTEHFFQVDNGGDTAAILISNNNFSVSAAPDTATYPFSVGISPGASNCIRELTGGYCLFFDVPDFLNWSVFPLVAGSSLVAQSNVVFPQPFDPANETVKIPYPYQQTNSASLSIYGISGNLVDELSGDANLSHFLRGSYFVWDGQDAAGKKVASGVYIYVVSDGSKSSVGKIAVVRNR